MQRGHAFSARLIVVDADGTLFTSDERVTDRTREALRDAQARGVHVAVATGRRRTRTREVFERLRLDNVYLISSQGTAVWRDPMGAEPTLIATNHLSTAAARQVLTAIRAHDLACVMLGNAGQPDVVWYDGDLGRSPTMARYVATNQATARPISGANDTELFGHDPAQFIILAPLGPLRNLRDDLVGRFIPRDTVEKHPVVVYGSHGSQTQPRSWHVIFSRGQFSAGAALEVVGGQTNKATAIRLLASHLGVEIGEVAAFGDNINDVEMLRSVGLGVAMGNATPSARAGAWAGIQARDGQVTPFDRIAPSNDQDGIAWTLDHLREGTIPAGWAPPLVAPPLLLT